MKSLSGHKMGALPPGTGRIRARAERVPSARSAPRRYAGNESPLRFLARYARCGVVISLLFLLTGCAARAATGRHDHDVLARLADEGILALLASEDAHALELNLTQAWVGDIVQSREVPVDAAFPRVYHMHFDAETVQGGNNWITGEAWAYGHFSGTRWRVGDFIEEGDFIAELTYGAPSQPLLIARHALALEREQFETADAQEHQSRVLNIENLRHDLQTAADGEWEALYLRLAVAELEYEQFLIRSENRRADFDQRLENINAPTETERMYAPVSGVISFVTVHTQPGMFRGVPNWTGTARRIVTITDTAHVQFTAQTPLYVLRYGDVVPVQMRGFGDYYFHAKVATDPMTQNIRREGLHDIHLVPVCAEEFAEFRRAVEEQLRSLTMISLSASTSIPVVQNGVLLERRAVMEENNRYFVMVYNEGRVGRRYVTVGPRTTTNISILSGLEPGTWVVLP